MNYKQAYAVTEWLLDQIRPACEIAEICGSLRRRKADVHDAEIVCKPNTATSRPEWGQKVYKSRLDQILDNLIFDGALFKTKGADKMRQYRIGRLWEAFGFEPPLNPFLFELWICSPPASWGILYMIRTGPAAFSKFMVTQASKGGALPDEYHVDKGAVWKGDQRIEIPDEQAYFDLCGMRWREPEKREPIWVPS